MGASTPKIPLLPNPLRQRLPLLLPRRLARPPIRARRHRPHLPKWHAQLRHRGNDAAKNHRARQRQHQFHRHGAEPARQHQLARHIDRPAAGDPGNQASEGDYPGVRGDCEWRWSGAGEGGAEWCADFGVLTGDGGDDSSCFDYLWVLLSRHPLPSLVSVSHTKIAVFRFCRTTPQSPLKPHASQPPTKFPLIRQNGQTLRPHGRRRLPRSRARQHQSASHRGR